MRLSAAEPIFSAIAPRLDARLDPGSRDPLAVAFSGGGDSLALLLAVHVWARRCGRRVIALTVDHGLNPDSAGWTRFCAERAGALGLEHRALVWEGEKPATGLSAAARAARHALLADAAREAGAGVVLMGHTADDLIESAAMRAAGSSVPSPREWSPSPAWPQGRGVFLLRPMLGLRRADLRVLLAERGETWIEDPANADPASLRARMRASRGADEFLRLPEPPDVRPLWARAEVDWAGVIKISREDLARAETGARRAFISAALLCAAGAHRPPRSDQVDRLLGVNSPPSPSSRTERNEVERRSGTQWRASVETSGSRISVALRSTPSGMTVVGGRQLRVCTLTGARVQVHEATFALTRDPGRLARVGAPLPTQREVVFDGRFALSAPGEGWSLSPAAGRLSRLPARERNALRGVPPGGRAALPLAVNSDGWVVCPLLDPLSWRARNLVQSRLMAACGLIQDEATLSHVGEMREEPLNQCGSLEGSVHELA